MGGDGVRLQARAEQPQPVQHPRAAQPWCGAAGGWGLVLQRDRVPPAGISRRARRAGHPRSICEAAVWAGGWTIGAGDPNIAPVVPALRGGGARLRVCIPAAAGDAARARQCALDGGVAVVAALRHLAIPHLLCLSGYPVYAGRPEPLCRAVSELAPPDPDHRADPGGHPLDHRQCRESDARLANLRPASRSSSPI